MEMPRTIPAKNTTTETFRSRQMHICVIFTSPPFFLSKSNVGGLKGSMAQCRDTPSWQAFPEPGTIYRQNWAAPARSDVGGEVRNSPYETAATNERAKERMTTEFCSAGDQGWPGNDESPLLSAHPDSDAGDGGEDDCEASATQPFAPKVADCTRLDRAAGDKRGGVAQRSQGLETSAAKGHGRVIFKGEP
ncbi:hypothetical protein CC78DRAFT_611603 [Lojkania enalia]|uniref:Uncharacterized protein n=1 Tax=Lojkania enalia TaxID=147567 RepID=A0A9P4TRK8_9PLEO|nr:hypothetical protein CC78DRAFT_611603 [Didymosphaeria enalia]